MVVLKSAVFIVLNLKNYNVLFLGFLWIGIIYNPKLNVPQIFSKQL